MVNRIPLDPSPATVSHSVSEVMTLGKSAEGFEMFQAGLKCDGLTV